MSKYHIVGNHMLRLNYVDLFQTNDALVAPLLRLKDNNVHVEEAERSLKKKEKFSELIILYEKKGLHEKGETVYFKPNLL